MLAYWVGSDLFAEYQDTNLIFFGGTGLITRDGFYKPSYHAFDFLHRLGNRLLSLNESCVITKDSDSGIQILCHNYKQLNLYYYQHNEENLTYDDYNKCMEDLDVKKLNILLQGMENVRYQVKSMIVNEEYGNSLGIWKEMGYQKELSLGDIKFLRQRCVPLLKTEYCEATERHIYLQLTLEPNEIRLIHISRAN